MERLQSNEARGLLLTQMEVLPRDEVNGLLRGERHWAITPDKIQGLATSALRGKRVEVMSRPTRPLPRKVAP